MALAPLLAHVWGTVQDVGEVALPSGTCFPAGLSPGGLAGEEGAGARVDAGLDDGVSVEGGGELAVAAPVEAVAAGGLARAAGDLRGSAGAGVGGRARRAADVAGVREDCDRDYGAGTG